MESIAATRPKPPRQTHGLPWLGAGALFGAIAVGAGAYGSHALRAELAEPLLVMCAQHGRTPAGASPATSWPQ